MNGIELIAAERNRQVTEENWTDGHDDLHAQEELANAAACYAMSPGFWDCLTRTEEETIREFIWPFHESWWKPKDRLRDLVRAGALIAAEIDRIQRGRS